ncbi:leucyl/phenylalanyl-tRNA--protein transferase [Salegentibacter salinarum]|uniref:Leucyl/phenylalanyl-tRNA--protein transferase n=1 Tax=Salegentibacter salinarum TaxID=447422 RepID=A0A2N0U4H8_9FLAO|nr:leucyl/phenylalanyl-tRNA--protein transferase [Salegentibacter salinarum]PKD21910.1 leucyl/phenylalanyl-tRNA--protein transferase [Salegentibacter salinarum]SKB32176.1 leucyl/phenylalanyl-tRNA--protein transferase [Salegentibacter salinarum]
MHYLQHNEKFPPISEADDQGLLAIGGDLSIPRLIYAYNHGIFPWYDDSQPVLWWSPDPRMVLFPEKLKVSKSMKQLFKKEAFTVTFDEDFEGVIEACAEIRREGQHGTWITPEIIKSYRELHEFNIARSVEVWQEDKLVGGLYGIYLKEQQVFCGESMFTTVSNASKYGFITLVDQLKDEGVKLIDCQVYTKHLESLGAEEISRARFLKYLEVPFED